MIETEPAFLHFFGQPGKPLVDRGPFSEMLQSGRTPLFERFFQMEPAFVIYVVIESYVDLGRCVGQEKPTGFREREAISRRIDEYGPD